MNLDNGKARQYLQEESGSQTQLGGERLPILNSVQPVLPLRHKVDIVKTGASTATGLVTIYTTDSGRQFYLTAAQFSYIKDNLCDQATGGISLSVVFNGATVPLISFAAITLTAQDGTIFQSFNPPIPLDPGSAITSTVTTTAGTIARRITVIGYYQ